MRAADETIRGNAELAELVATFALRLPTDTPTETRAAVIGELGARLIAFRCLEADVASLRVLVRRAADSLPAGEVPPATLVGALDRVLARTRHDGGQA
jgi:hypothetical protein